MEKMNRILELFWLFMTIIVATMVIYLISTEGYDKGYNKWLVVLPLLTAAVYFLRRGLRIRFEKQRKEYQQKKQAKN